MMLEELIAGVSRAVEHLTNRIRALETADPPAGFAPSSADFLVGTAHPGLSAEIVVGTTPGGELGNTWPSPTVDATHSGSSHANLPAGAQVNGVDVVTTTGAQAISNKTTVAATTLAGTLSTAAQPNITSLGTLTTVTVSGDTVLSGSANQILFIYGTAAAFIRMQDTGGGADLKYIDIVTDGGAIDVRLLNDDTTVKHTALTIASDGGLVVGAPTGGSQGVGTINVSANIYLNNSAYGNPGYVLEHWLTGAVKLFAEKGWDYPGLLSLPEVEAYIRQHYELPRVAEKRGMFDRLDVLLEKVEELTIYAIAADKRANDMEARLLALEQPVI